MNLSLHVSTPHTVMDPKDALLKGYQEEIRLHHKAIQGIKTKMNLISPIFKLPAEIMIIIFSLVKGGPSLYDRNCQIIETWISEITHICRHWREMALNAPTLWNDPSKSSEKLTEYLTRSKNTALYIEWTNMSTPPGRASLGQLVPHTSRIKDLRLYWTKYTNKDHDMLLQISSCRLESLESLYLSSATVPNALLTETKALRQVLLSHCTVRWEYLSRNELEFLSLANCVSSNNTSPTLPRLMSVIAGMASLTSLTLSDTFVSQRDSVGYPRIHLASLETFDVKSYLVEAVALFRSVVFPRTAKVTISTVLLDNQSEKIKSLFAAIKDSRSLGPEEAVYLTLLYTERDYVDDWTGPVIELSVFTKAIKTYSPLKGFNVEQDVHPNFNISLGWLDRAINTDGNVRSILATFTDSGIIKMDSIKYVYLESEGRLNTCADAATLLSTIGRLPAINDISASGGIMQTLLKALQCGFDDSSEHHGFPNLAVLGLLGDEDFVLDTDILLESLRRRREYNIGLRKLMLNESKNQWISDEILVKLLQVVDCLQLTTPDGKINNI